MGNGDSGPPQNRHSERLKPDIAGYYTVFRVTWPLRPWRFESSLGHLLTEFPPFKCLLSGGIAMCRTVHTSVHSGLLGAGCQSQRTCPSARPPRSCRSTELPDTRDIHARSPSTKRDPSSPAHHVPHETERPPLSGSFSAVEVVAGRPMLPGGGLSRRMIWPRLGRRENVCYRQSSVFTICRSNRML